MGLPLQMVCSDCGRSVTWSGDEVVGPPSACRICGGRIGGDSADFQIGPGPSATPPSLQLTPDEACTGEWGGDRDIPPESIGRFRICELLGNGGFGQVYRAVDSRLERDVALKVLRDNSPPARVLERFFREARAAAKLDHPNIVGLYDAGRDAGRCWIAYQYIAGKTLGRHREERGRDHRESARIVRELADALDHAHNRGVYHRDLKPANILVDLAGRPRLTDFGLARRVDFDATMTREGAIIGTANYMSPEQKSGNSHSADGRSDIYSLGVVFHELLCGRRPLDMPTNAPAWKTLAATRPAKPSARACDRSVPKALEHICLKALATDPDDRYLDARAMADDLDDFLARRSSSILRPALVGMLLVAAVVAREAVALAARPWSRHPEPVAMETETPTVPTAEPLDVQPVATLKSLRRSGIDITRLVGNGSEKKGKLHLDTCHAVAQMAAANRVPFERWDEVTREKYIPCQNAKCLRGYQIDE